MGKITAFYALPHPPIIIPEVGGGDEKEIRKTSDAFNKVSEELADKKPDVIILVTPHGPLFRDAVALSHEHSIKGNMGRFGVPDVTFQTDIEIPLTDKIMALAEEKNIMCVSMDKSTAAEYRIRYELDHGAMVPLYFVNKTYTDYKLVHITYGMLPKMQLYRFGMCIRKAVEQTACDAAFIASGDLSHRLKEDGPYDYSPYGEKFDSEIISLLEKGDTESIFNMDPVMVENAGECALRSYYIMLGALNGCKYSGKLLSYQGNFGVGYLVMKFDTVENGSNTYERLVRQEEAKFEQRLKGEDAYVKLARESLAYYLAHGSEMKIPGYVTDEMKEMQRGVFVSIKKAGELRGCIGTIEPAAGCIAEEIIRNAIEAGIHDPRFPSIEEDELADLDFSVDVLTEPEEASKEQLDPKKYGVIVRSGYRTGLLLPDLEGVDTVEDQLNIALRKAGISPDKNYTIQRFEVIRHKGDGSAT